MYDIKDAFKITLDFDFDLRNEFVGRTTVSESLAVTVNTLAPMFRFWLMLVAYCPALVKTGLWVLRMMLMVIVVESLC